MCASVNITSPEYVERLSKAAARSADMPDRSIEASPEFPPDASKVIVPVVALLIAFKSARLCGCVIETFAASKLTNWAFSSVTFTSSAGPVTSVTFTDVTLPDVLPATAVKSAALADGPSETVIEKLDEYFVKSDVVKAMALAIVLSYDSSTVSPPPQAASGSRRSGIKPFLFFPAALTHFLRNASRALPAGIEIFSI